jgi:hypothetical protein
MYTEHINFYVALSVNKSLHTVNATYYSFIARVLWNGHIVGFGEQDVEIKLFGHKGEEVTMKR